METRLTALVATAKETGPRFLILSFSLCGEVPAAALATRPRSALVFSPGFILLSQDIVRARSPRPTGQADGGCHHPEHSSDTLLMKANCVDRQRGGEAGGPGFKRDVCGA